MNSCQAVCSKHSATDDNSGKYNIKLFRIKSLRSFTLHNFRSLYFELIDSADVYNAISCKYLLKMCRLIRNIQIWNRVMWNYADFNCNNLSTRSHTCWIMHISECVEFHIEYAITWLNNPMFWIDTYDYKRLTKNFASLWLIELLLDCAKFG